MREIIDFFNFSPDGVERLAVIAAIIIAWLTPSPTSFRRWTVKIPRLPRSFQPARLHETPRPTCCPLNWDACPLASQPAVTQPADRRTPAIPNVPRPTDVAAPTDATHARRQPPNAR